ncbi:hypothetical protein Pla110_03660 [Polystyrenella longa]|uniref:Rod shape-determining protein MreB n=1 Tax=Polystyrenella longa TaxID=2528007 RepID=A0A518CHF9_9PLAN|nr:hypothetical protein [Polystyrenella longa]QDU78662.1 hypothetical protein Pla110_03660 [Polystyrenella longa]
MSISLDVGTDTLKSLRRQGNQLIAKKCRGLFAVMDGSETRRELLNNLKIPYSTAEEQIVLMGDAASHYGEMFQTSSLSLFTEAKSRSDEAVLSAEVLQALIQSILDKPRYAQETCAVVLPATNVNRKLITAAIRDLGYQPLIISSGMAIILAEMVKTSFNGIGLSLGAGSCTMSLAHHGEEVARYTLPLGANWVDEQLAEANEDIGFDSRGHRYLKTERVRNWKESHTGAFVNPSTEGELILKEVYTQMLKELFTQAGENFSLIPRVLNSPQPMTMAVSGGPSRLPGIREMIERTLLTTPFPIEINRVRVVSESLYVVSRGALIHAELEQESSLRKAG